MGVLMIVASIGISLGPIILGKAVDRFGVLSAFSMMSGVLVVAMAIDLPIEETGKKEWRKNGVYDRRSHGV